MEAPIPASSGEGRGWGRFRGVVRRLLHAQKMATDKKIKEKGYESLEAPT
uniref:Uncharacterized protein n=1 Tax=Oryza brachyantha TaxID=4533 RepID=J3N878_ORYBR